MAPPLHALARPGPAGLYVSPPIVKDQRGRPSPPLAPLGESDIARCIAVLGGRWKGGRVSLLTYLTDPGYQGAWALGLSAAYHGIPLVVQGLGMRWGGVGFKLSAVRRATQILQALRPNAPVVFADGSDTVVANSPQHLRLKDRRRTMMLSGECGSFPLCYEKHYEQHEAHQACRRSSHSCYPNSGVYIGHPEALLEVLPALRTFASTGTGVEHNEDQSAANRLYYSQAGNASQPYRVEVDGDSELFLSLYNCKGPPVRRFDRFTLCHYGHHDPLRYVQRVDKVSLSYNYSGRATRPFIVHSSGMHQRLNTAYFGSGRPQVGAPRNWTDLFVPDRATAAAARAHPVLLVDSVAHGLCHVTTLGELTSGTQGRIPHRTADRLNESRIEAT